MGRPTGFQNTILESRNFLCCQNRFGQLIFQGFKIGHIEPTFIEAHWRLTFWNKTHAVFTGRTRCDEVLVAAGTGRSGIALSFHCVSL
jgi:hypothetical protein